MFFCLSAFPIGVFIIVFKDYTHKTEGKYKRLNISYASYSLIKYLKKNFNTFVLGFIIISFLSTTCINDYKLFEISVF